MKTLENHILVYDAECPLCKVYSKGFIQCGMLEKEGRMDFSQMNPEIEQLLDIDHARNEIALVDLQHHTVKYGIDSLFHILRYSFPILKFLFSFPPFYWSMKIVYRFISFNRRVVLGGRQEKKVSSCVPDFNLLYRLLYLGFAALVSSFILTHFSPLLGIWWPIPQGWKAELLLVSGQIGFQLIVLYFFAPKIRLEKMVDYAGQLMTVALLGSLLLLPAVWISKFVPALPLFTYLAWLGVVLLVMFAEHWRRVKVCALPPFLCYTWVLYRAFASAIGLYFLTT